MSSISDFVGGAGVPVGTIIEAAATAASLDNGKWLKADGQIVTQADYPKLFAITGLRDTIRTLPGNPPAVASYFRGGNIYHDGSKFVGALNSGVVSTSTDGITWTAGVNCGTAVTAFKYFGGNYIALNGPTWRVSADAVTWSSAIGPLSCENVAYSGTVYVAVCSNNGTTDNIYSGTSLGAVTTARAATGQYMYSVAYGGGLFVAGGNNGKIVTSPDGVTWTTRTSPASERLDYAVYLDGLYILASTTGNAPVYSSDGVTWATGTVSGTYNGVPITAMNTKSILKRDSTWYAVGAAYVFTSTDGINWTLLGAHGGSVNGATFADGKLVLVGGSGTTPTARYTTDFAEWSPAYNLATEFKTLTFALGSGTPGGSSSTTKNVYIRGK